MKMVSAILSLLGLLLAEKSIPNWELLQRTMNFVFEDEFQSANSTIDSMISVHPDDPTFLVFSIIVKASEIRYMEDYSQAENLWTEIISTEARCKEKWKKQMTPWQSFCYGALLSYKALLRMALEKGGILDLWGDISESADFLEKAMVEPDIGNEAAVGLGNYYYWSSSKAGLLRKVGIIKDRRKEGIALLRRAYEKSLLSKDTALHSLVFVLLADGDTIGALNAAKELSKRHPGRTTSQWDMLFVQYSMRNWQKVLPLVDSLLLHYKDASKFNSCQLSIIGAKASFEMNETALARRYLEKPISLKNDRDILKRLKKMKLWDLLVELEQKLDRK